MRRERKGIPSKRLMSAEANRQRAKYNEETLTKAIMLGAEFGCDMTDIWHWHYSGEFMASRVAGGFKSKYKAATDFLRKMKNAGAIK